MKATTLSEAPRHRVQPGRHTRRALITGAAAGGLAALLPDRLCRRNQRRPARGDAGRPVPRAARSTSSSNWELVGAVRAQRRCLRGLGAGRGTDGDRRDTRPRQLISRLLRGIPGARTRCTGAWRCRRQSPPRATATCERPCTSIRPSSSRCPRAGPLGRRKRASMADGRQLRRRRGSVPAGLRASHPLPRGRPLPGWLLTPPGPRSPPAHDHPHQRL